MAHQTARDAYEELIAEQLTQERQRKDSIERRGLAVVSSAGTLAALLLAIVAVVSRPAELRTQGAPIGLFAAAAILFALSGGLGIWTNKPSNYAEPSAQWLARLLWPAVWQSNNETLARRRIAEARLRSVESFRDVNEKKVAVLTAAIIIEVVAIALVAVALLVTAI